MLNPRHRWGAYLLCLTLSLSGCLGKKEPEERHYLGEEDLKYYRNHATEVAFPAIEECPTPQVHLASAPHTIADRAEDEICDVTLDDCIRIALQNNKIIRTVAGNPFGGTSQLLNAPDSVPSVYDPAIQESGVLFGRRGVEAALADFDARLATSMFWGRNETYLNAPPAVAGGPLQSQVLETGTFRSSISKAFGYGGTFAVSNDWDYLGTNSPAAQFPSLYTGSLRAEYSQPLLAGAGPEFTRIAGPISPNSDLTGITGVSQGVLIARINGDISIADFEANVRDMMLSIENAYWDLYLQYRLYDTAVLARNSALRSWNRANQFEIVGQGARWNEPQARDRYYETQAQVETALNNIYNAELRLRQLLNMSVNDGCILRPIEEPTTAKIDPDWRVCLTEALTNRVELRRQKWSIKSLELQLCAAQSLTQPRLDFVSGYQLNGFGDDLFGGSGAPGTSTPVGSAVDTLSSGDLTGWNMGLRFSMPIGFRQAHAQVRNYELRIARARQLLAAQEVDISHELATSFQNLVATYTTAQSNYNRLQAARSRESVLRRNWEAGEAVLDELLRAEESVAFAQSNYWQSVTSYNQQLAALHFSKGTLLVQYNIQLAEGQWTPEAYKDALERAWARTYACENVWLETSPPEFSIPTGHPYEHHHPLGTAIELPPAEPGPELPEDQREPQPVPPVTPQENYDENMRELPPVEPTPINPAEPPVPGTPVTKKKNTLNPGTPVTPEQRNTVFQAIPLLSEEEAQPSRKSKILAKTTADKRYAGPVSLNREEPSIQPASGEQIAAKPSGWKSSTPQVQTVSEPASTIPDEYLQPINPQPVRPASVEEQTPAPKPAEPSIWRKRLN